MIFSISFAQVKEVFEFIYYIISIGLLIGVFVAIQQLKLMKEDFRVKNKRASIEHSIEYLNLFSTEFIPKTGEYEERTIEEGIKYYEGPFNEQFVFDEDCNLDSDEIRKNLVISHRCGAVGVMNRFEYFSAALLSGVADEDLAFNPLSRLFCDYVEKLYVPICFSRRDGNTTSFSNTVGLYNKWKKRLTKMELEKKRSELEKEISDIDFDTIQSLGSK